jgi:hypothetical protein
MAYSFIAKDEQEFASTASLVMNKPTGTAQDDLFSLTV